jgi:2-methylcitrate dehydratase PrpD
VYQKFHSSGSWGAIGGAAAAGRVLGLKANTLSQAMGVAEYHAPIAPMMKCIETPSMVKDSIGWGCMVAVFSVLMSREGFTGIKPLFDDTPNREWIENLGKNYEVMNLYFKPYAACRWAQPAVNGALKLCREFKIGVEEIGRIQVRTFQEAKELSNQAPADTEEAQYSLTFPVAAALIEGEVGPRQVLPPGIYNRRILDLAQKVEAETEPQFEAAFPAKAYAEVIIVTTNGERLSSGRVEAEWEPPDTLPTDAELEDKFVWLVEPVLGKAKTRQLLTSIWNLEAIDNLGEFISTCIK